MISGKMNPILGKYRHPLKTWLQSTIRNQKLGLVPSEALPQKLHGPVLGRKCIWILVISNTVPFYFFFLYSLQPLGKPSSQMVS